VSGARNQSAFDARKNAVFAGMAAVDPTAPRARLRRFREAGWKELLTGEWFIDLSTARQRRIIHYWLTIAWLTVGLVLWLVLRQALWFVGFMSLYAIWITHLAGWAAETPVERERDDEGERPSA